MRVIEHFEFYSRVEQAIVESIATGSRANVWHATPMEVEDVPMCGCDGYTVNPDGSIDAWGEAHNGTWRIHVVPER